ncbi:NnrS family protein [Shewanella sp. UCD-KL12]|uniref:NnrS family protein n=1 Tax=Shewanella sp. UCD-KL12 TaxID=1917163 RepID=UPI002116D1CF|nr:NnrS family protein [Shewanella sp. UCD-KL12]
MSQQQIINHSKAHERTSQPKSSKQTLRFKLTATGEIEQVSTTRLAIESPLTKFTNQPIWDLCFRPWFLAATTLSALSLAIWILYLNGQFSGFNSEGISPLVWHIHEMLFGFGASIAVGFLLTAAQTWTKVRSINGLSLALLTGIWLSVRILLLSSSANLQLLAISLQALWWLVSIGYLAYMVLRAQSRRNYQFIPLLSAMMLLNLAFLLADFFGDTQLALHLSRSAILMFGLLVGIVGGRVIPFFTSRGAESAQVQATPMLDKLLPLVTLSGIAVFFSGYFISLPFTPATLLILAGSLHLARLYFWNSLSTCKVPLLWSLHASYLALGLGLILLGASYLSENLRFADALHLITIGTIGGMILAMIARVSLGHTGRALKPHPAMNLAFALIFIGALARVILPLFQQPLWGWNISAATWIIAFILFLWHYTPILCRARQ